MVGEREEFECPDCGAGFPYGTATCPGCSAHVEWGEEDDREGSEGDHREDARVTETELRRDLDRVRSELDSGSGPGAAPLFSRLGLACALLTVLAFFGTLLVLKWDTWVQGAPEEVIGDDQRLLIYLGALATTVLSIVTIWDVTMRPRLSLRSE